MASSDITVAGLTATGDVKGIKLKWTYSDPRSNALPNIGLDMVEVYAAATNDRTTATKVGEGITDYLHAGLNRGDVRYYWIKARDYLGGFGAWYPSSPTGGVSGTEVSGDVLIAIDGYWKHPSGLIEQWLNETVNAGPSDTILNLRITFPNDILSVQVTPLAASASGTFVAQVTAASVSTITVAAFKIAGGVITQPGCGVYVRALGY